MEPLEREDQEILDSIPELPQIKASSSFKKEVYGRIKEHSSGRIVNSPWKKSKPWIIALLSHAALLAVFANIYLAHSNKKAPESLQVVLYQQRSNAYNHSKKATIDNSGTLVLSTELPGEMIRLVPLKECVGVFNYNQWKRLSSVTKSAYESESGFYEVQLSKDKKINLATKELAYYFASSKKANILKFVDRSEIWNSDTLSIYLDEYPVQIEKAVIIPW